MRHRKQGRRFNRTRPLHRGTPKADGQGICLTPRGDRNHDCHDHYAGRPGAWWRVLPPSTPGWHPARLLDCLLPGGLLVTTVNGKGWDDLDWDTLLEDSRRRHGFSIESVEDIPYLAKQGIGGKLLVLKP